MREDTVRKRLTKSKLRLRIHFVQTAAAAVYSVVPICALKSYWLAGSINEQNPENIFARSDCWVEDWLVLQPAEDSILWGWLPLLLVRVVVSADRCRDDN